MSQETSNWPPEWPAEMQPQALRVVGALFRSRNYVWENDQKVVAEFGLTWGQFQTLAALRSAEGGLLAPTQLYDAARVSSGGLTKLLIGLCEKGYVTRKENPEDGRSKLVQLTADGAQAVEALVERLMEGNEALIGSILSGAEFEQLTGLLERLESGLRQK